MSFIKSTHASREAETRNGHSFWRSKNVQLFLCPGIFNFRFPAFLEKDLVLNKSWMQMRISRICIRGWSKARTRCQKSANSPGIKIKSVKSTGSTYYVAYSSSDKIQPPNSISHVHILRSPSHFVSTQLQSDRTLIPAERVPETADWALAMAEDKSGVVLIINEHIYLLKSKEDARICKCWVESSWRNIDTISYLLARVSRGRLSAEEGLKNRVDPCLSAFNPTCGCFELRNDCCVPRVRDKLSFRFKCEIRNLRPSCIDRFLDWCRRLLKSHNGLESLNVACGVP